MSERGREWKLEVYLDSLSEGGSDGMLVHGVCARVCLCAGLSDVFASHNP